MSWMQQKKIIRPYWVQIHLFTHSAVEKNHIIVLSAIMLSSKLGVWNGTFLFIVGKNNTSVKYPLDVMGIWRVTWLTVERNGINSWMQLGIQANPHLKGHMQTHSGGKPDICVECNKIFHQGGRWRTHMSIHSHTCTRCNQTFSLARTLKIHRLIHQREKRYDCVQCVKFFHRSEHLKTHMLVHTREKSYICRECICKQCKNSFSIWRFAKTEE